MTPCLFPETFINTINVDNVIAAFNDSKYRNVVKKINDFKDVISLFYILKYVILLYVKRKFQRKLRNSQEDFKNLLS